MKKHTKIYMDYFDYCKDDVIVCEVCQMNKAVDIHHINNKGIGGSSDKDYIENLIGVCRMCHNNAHNEKLTKQYLIDCHALNLR